MSRSARLLLVEPDVRLRTRLRGVAAPHALIDADAAAPAARTRLLTGGYDWLVTNIRLEAYNGLHLAYLANLTARPIRILVYGDRADLPLAREAQTIGAFFEPRTCIADSLPGYLSTELPPSDRRAAYRPDRRTSFRGGRRSGDLPSWPAMFSMKMN